MAPTVRQVRVEARRLAAGGDAIGALRLYDHLLATHPTDFGSRQRIAELAMTLGAGEVARRLATALAEHDLRAGHPLPAIVACKALAAFGGNPRPALQKLATLYGQGSPALGKVTARQSPLDPNEEVPPLKGDGAGGISIGDAAELIERATTRALDFSAFPDYPAQVLPIPFLSDLPPPLLLVVLEVLGVHNLGPGDVILRQGELGSACYLLASGEARVFSMDAAGQATERARLHENALFGEMALLSAEPRTATVQVVDEADVLELTRDAITALSAERAELAAILDRFARERMLKNLLASSPLFKPFTRQQQFDLIRRFEGHEVAPGTEIIREGEPGRGLFVVLAGECEVIKGASTDGRPPNDVALARLHAGDLFGEMSLVQDRPTVATVRATRQSSILFLARQYFQRLIEALPEIRRYFEELSQRRDLENRLTLGEGESASFGGEGDTDPDVMV